MYKETINEFKKLAKEYHLLGNDSDLYVYGDIPNYVEESSKRYFKIPENEEVLYIRDTSSWNIKDQGVVITDKCIRYIQDNDSPNKCIILDWNDIQEVEYKKSIMVFHMAAYLSDEYIKIPIYNFKKVDLFGEELALVFTLLAKTQNHDTARAALARMENCLNKYDYDKAIEEADNALSMSETDNKDISRLAMQGKAYAYMGISEIDKQNCHTYCYKSLRLFEEVEKILGNPMAFIAHKAKLHFMGKLQEDSDEIARRYCIAAMHMKGVLDVDKEKNQKLYKQVTDCIFDNTLNSEGFCKHAKFSDRQFLLLARNEKQIAGMYDPEENIKWVFTLDKIPLDIEFEGIPQANTLYLAHPVRPNLYLPYEGAEEKLFMDKVREFCYLVQCLGATEVIFHSNKGMKISESFSSNQTISGGASYKIIGANGETSRNNSKNSNQSQKVVVDMIQTFAPTKYPYQPDDLVWLSTDTSWKQLIKQRLEGGILSYTYKISSTDVKQVTNSQASEIKSSFRFMLLNANTNYNESEDKTFREEEDTEWSIQVTFKPLNELSNQSAKTTTNRLFSNAQGYIDDFKTCITENKDLINYGQRHLLDKMRKILDTTENLTTKLESICSVSQLTDEEKEYLAEYKECLNDGGSITASERRLLERLRKSLGIS